MNYILLGIQTPEISYFDLGPLRIHFYALFILTGIIFALLLTESRLKTRGVEPGVALDIAIWAIPFGIVGGRLFHVITHPSDYFYPDADLLATLRIWEGGLAIYGALLLGAVGAYIGARQAGVKFLSYLDAVAPGVLLAQAIGRWGNFFNEELFGKPTSLPWGLEISSNNPAYPVGLPDGVLFHPTFLYESLWALAGVALLLALDKRYDLRWGKMFALYAIYYSLGRIFVENLRVDPSEVILGLRVNVWSAIFGILVGILVFLVQSRRHIGVEETVYLEGRAPTPDDGLESVTQPQQADLGTTSANPKDS
jgi:prolipoprotein diacylglyceryl transferase